MGHGQPGRWIRTFKTLVMQVAGRLASGPTGAFAAGKKAFNHAILPNLEETLEL